MDIHKVLPRTKVPVPTCGEMQAGCLSNVNQVDREEPNAKRKHLDACDALRDWVESDGKLEKDKRRNARDYWRDQVYRLASDRRHWLLQGQAWRQALALHPELASQPVGTRCSHGDVMPICSRGEPARSPGAATKANDYHEKEPGDDDGDE